MKYLILFLVVFTLTSCENYYSSEIVKSDKGNKWKIEVIESHEFLYRIADGTVVYIHRPNCKTCSKNQSTK
jgi:hypothetical protein